MECLKWLRSEGCPWDARACAGAALDGHLDVLQWAIDNGCPYVVTDRTRRAYESLGLARASHHHRSTKARGDQDSAKVSTWEDALGEAMQKKLAKT